MLLEYIAKKITPPPEAPANSLEAVNAWGKLDRVVNTAYCHAHLNVAENMLERVLDEFHFTPEQRASALVVGMRNKIFEARQQIID